VNKRVLRVVGLIAALVLVFVIGAAAGGGIVFAATRIGPLNHTPVALAQQPDSEPGIVIAAVAPDGPAAQAGLKRGDILLKFNGEAVNNAQELVGHLGDLKSGDQVELTVLHGDEERTLTATLGDRNGQPYLGVSPCGGLPGGQGRVYLQMTGPGARIIEVVPDSPAARAGLKAGDLIAAVDGQKLDSEHSLADLIAQHKPGDSVTLEVTSPGEESREVTVELGENPDKAGAAYLGVQYLPTPPIQPSDGQSSPLGNLPFDGHPFGGKRFFISPGAQVEQGAVVRSVVEGSPAEAAGLKQGDIITAIDGEALDGPQALVDAVAQHQPGDVLKLTVYRPQDEAQGGEAPQGGGTLELEATLAEHPDKAGQAYLGVATGGFFRMRRFDGNQQLPGLEDLQRRLQLELPFKESPLDQAVAPYGFQFQVSSDACCGAEFSQV
jgi:S1-C subfamily serine protease